MAKELIIDGQTLHYEIGHSTNEWEETYGADNLWEILLEEFMDGSVEVNEDIVYWYIDGRMYETTIDA